MAETTTITRRVDFIRLITRIAPRMASGVPRELPPNFNTLDGKLAEESGIAGYLACA